MSRNQARFSQMPRAAVIDTRLTSTDFKVLAIIGLYLNHDFDAWPSQDTIAEVGDMSRRTVIRAIQNLEEFGYIESRKKFPNRPGTHKCYRVIMDVTPESAISDTSDKDRGAKPESDKIGTSESAARVTYGSDIAVSHPIGTNPVELSEAKASVEAHASVLPLTIPEQQNPQKGKSKVRGTARAVSLPANWSPNIAVQSYASQHGLSRQEINHEADQFRNHAIANGKRFKDWDAAFRTWIGNTVKWRAERAARTSAGPNPGRKSGSGGLVAAGLRAVSEARGYGEPVSEGRGMGAGDVIDGDAFRLTGS